MEILYTKMNLKSSTPREYYRRMKPNVHAFLAGAATIILLASCAGGGTPRATVEAAASVAPETPGKAVKGAPQGLVDRVWTNSGFNTGTQFVPLEPGHGSDAWIRFAADGTLAGYTGTNNFTGSWKLGTKNAKGAYPVAINLGGMTRKAALNEIAARFELSFIENLAKSVTLLPGKDSLALKDAAGDERLTFVFIAADESR